MKLEPFNLTATCPKCGYDNIGAIYHKKPEYSFPCWAKFDSPEHICRSCHKCSYKWMEACIKKEKKDAKQ